MVSIVRVNTMQILATARACGNVQGRSDSGEMHAESMCSMDQYSQFLEQWVMEEGLPIPRKKDAVVRGSFNKSVSCVTILRESSRSS